MAEWQQAPKGGKAEGKKPRKGPTAIPSAIGAAAAAPDQRSLYDGLPPAAQRRMKHRLLLSLRRRVEAGARVVRPALGSSFRSMGGVGARRTRDDGTVG
jgi:hypothetical protein